MSDAASDTSLINSTITAWGDILQPLATVLVAVIVGYFAINRELRSRKIERFHQFMDKRSNDYIEFLREMNSTVGAFWSTRGSSSIPRLEEADKQALALDTQTYILTLTAPNEVSLQARQINGALQTAIIERLSEEKYKAPLQAFEEAKLKLLIAMQNDLELIEGAGDRRSYEKLRAKRRLK